MRGIRTPFCLGFAGLFAAALAPGCAPSEEDASTADELGASPTWELPSDVAAAGARIRISYEDAPAWNGGRSCTGSLREGARELGSKLRDRFDVIASVGGYACRPNSADTSRASVHGTGRALDVMIPAAGDAADSAAGDPIANWLVVNAANIGVDLIIWNHTIWRANGTNVGPYGGPVPHVDHLHVELTEAAARKTTPFFTRGASIDVGGARVPGGTTVSDAGGTRKTPSGGASGDYDASDEAGDPEDTPIYVGGTDPPSDSNGPGDSPYGPGDVPGGSGSSGGGYTGVGSSGPSDDGTAWPSSPTATPTDAGGGRPTPAAAAPVAPPPVSLADGTVGAHDSLGTGTRATPPPKSHLPTHPPIETCAATPIGSGTRAPASALALMTALAMALVSRAARRRAADRSRE